MLHAKMQSEMISSGLSVGGVSERGDALEPRGTISTYMFPLTLQRQVGSLLSQGLRAILLVWAVCAERNMTSSN